MLTWKTQMWEKPRQPTDCRIHYEKGIQRWGYIEATTSCTRSSPHGGYNGGNDLSLSLTLSLYTHARQLLTTKMQQQHFMFALSHIYTHMTFGLFTHMAPRGPQEHIYICVPSNRLGGTPPGLRSSGSPKLPIRRDLFPNRHNAPLRGNSQEKHALLPTSKRPRRVYQQDPTKSPAKNREREWNGLGYEAAQRTLGVQDEFQNKRSSHTI